ncbi:MAG: superoxide dismutase [Bacteroidaceae bacterium]|nr:superoxide dismutase [Bacteroidaceae bacterium]
MTQSTFQLLPLPYAEDALSPIISSKTISYHYGKHLLTYLNNLNAAIEGSGMETLSLEEIVKQAEDSLLNNAGQVLNHNLYFSQFQTPDKPSAPSGKLKEAITKDFGSVEAFQKAFQNAGTTLFGSGWAWLSADHNGHLLITQEPNAGNPIRRGLRPLLTFDVWEHAYYLDYQNRRADHLAALWQIVDWDVVAERYNKVFL